MKQRKDRTLNFKSRVKIQDQKLLKVYSIEIPKFDNNDPIKLEITAFNKEHARHVAIAKVKGTRCNVEKMTINQPKE